MKRVTVEEGVVRCPKCGASSFRPKRSVKGKVALGLLSPKRLKCNGCGALVKAG